jgi:hypothetical protein
MLAGCRTIGVPICEEGDDGVRIIHPFAPPRRVSSFEGFRDALETRFHVTMSQ